MLKIYIPLVKMDDSKLNIVLDLDNTLICAEIQKEFPFKDETMKHKAVQFKFHDMDGYYIVFERPGVQTFLDFLFQHFNVSIWTAASKDYALFIADKIVLQDPKRDLKYLMFSYHVDLADDEYHGGTKDLRLLHSFFKLPGFTRENTLIIDDLEDVKKTQPDACIHLKAFKFFDALSEKDNELVKVQHLLRQRLGS